MVMAVEIALAVYGFFGLITGTLIVSKSKVVRGYRARLLALVALVPLIAAFVLIATFTGAPNRLALIEGILTGTVVVLVFGTGALIGVNPDAGAPTEEAEDEDAIDGDESAAEVDETEEGEEAEETEEAESREMEPATTDVEEPEPEPQPEPEPELVTGPVVAEEPGSPPTETEKSDYFGAIAEHLDYFDMEPETGPLSRRQKRPEPPKPEAPGAPR